MVRTKLIAKEAIKCLTAFIMKQVRCKGIKPTIALEQIITRGKPKGCDREQTWKLTPLTDNRLLLAIIFK